MTKSVFSRMFSLTHGSVSIFDHEENIGVLTSDHVEVTRFAILFPSSHIDLVTDEGEAAGLLVPGDGYAMYPPPTLVLDGGGLYLNNGEPLLGQPHGQLFIPSDLLGEIDGCPFYSLKELKVKEVPALARPKVPDTRVDPALLKGKSEAEKKHLLQLNHRCSVGLLGSQLRIIWQPDKQKPAKFLSVSDAREREATRVVYVKGEGGSTRKLNMFNEWKEWSGRPEFDEIKFAPGDDNPNIYNLFQGWAVQPRAGDWSHLRDHIYRTICNGNDEQFNWLITWLAHIFQFPGEKNSVAVVIRGKKGTGKSILWDFVYRLMPHNFYKVADGKRALGNFNAQYETTLLLLLEEAFWAGDQGKEAILKDLITSPTIPIERKGVDPYMARNHMRIAMVSNDRWVVPASDDERRYAVYDCGDGHRGDAAYFKMMVDQMNAGGLAAMLYDLLTFEPEHGWGILNTAPITSGLKEQVVESLRGIDHFMYELLSAGMYECDEVLEGGIFLSEHGVTSVSMKELRAAVRDHLKDHYVGHKAASYDLVARAVRDWFGAEVVTRRAQQNDVRWVDFPCLPDARAHIRRAKGLAIEVPVRAPAMTPARAVGRLRAVPPLH